MTAATRPRATARVRAATAVFVLDQTDFPPVDVSAIQLVQRSSHVGLGTKLDNALIGAFLMCISIGHLSCLSHEVFKVLPTAAA